MENKFNDIKLYPYVEMPDPEAETFFQEVSDDGLNKKGKIFACILSCIEALHLKELRDDVCVRLFGHSYYTDLAYINERKHIYVDIEIDEPYTLHNHASHYLNHEGISKDHFHDKAFASSGWYVIRFSEEQMFCHTKECLFDIYEFLHTIGAIEEIPSQLKGNTHVTPQKKWTHMESKKWIEKKQRREYLGFNPCELSLCDIPKRMEIMIPIYAKALISNRIRKYLFK